MALIGPRNSCFNTGSQKLLYKNMSGRAAKAEIDEKVTNLKKMHLPVSLLVMGHINPLMVNVESHVFPRWWMPPGLF